MPLLIICYLKDARVELVPVKATSRANEFWQPYKIALHLVLIAKLGPFRTQTGRR